MSNNNDGCNHRNSNSNRVFRALDLRIRSLSFRSFQQLVLLWLGARGYRHIESLGRYHRRGRRSIGGADFHAMMPNSDVKVAVQIKHWTTPISRRAVDELWGFMLRQGIPTGLIITNSTFSMRAIQAALEYPGRPIRFYSRLRLTAWLACSGLALRNVGNREVIDEGFFRVLEASRFAGSTTKLSSYIPIDYDKESCTPTDTPTREENPNQVNRPLVVLTFVVVLVILTLLLFLLYGGV